MTVFNCFLLMSISDRWPSLTVCHLSVWTVLTGDNFVSQSLVRFLGYAILHFAGTFNLHVRVEYLFFIGSQLVALSPSGKLGVWHAMTQHWQTQDVMPIASFDTAGSILLLGCNNGCIYYIGKFQNLVFKPPKLF